MFYSTVGQKLQQFNIFTSPWVLYFVYIHAYVRMAFKSEKIIDTLCAIYFGFHLPVKIDLYILFNCSEHSTWIECLEKRQTIVKSHEKCFSIFVMIWLVLLSYVSHLVVIGMLENTLAAVFLTCRKEYVSQSK